MSGPEFFDTNILLYMYNEQDPQKQARSRALFREAAQRRRLVLSTQVVQEFYVTGRRKLSLPRRELEATVADLLALHLVAIGAEHILRAIQIEERYQISFWDALILAAAESAKAEVVYTEDLNDGQRYGTVIARNPFSGN